LPPKEKNVDGVYDPEDEDETYEEAWLHLQYVYEFFLLFLGLPMFDRELAKQFVAPHFVLKVFLSAYMRRFNSHTFLLLLNS